MYQQAKGIGQPVGMAMALRVQGQIFYKLNLYEKAYSVLREGSQTCPSYKESPKRLHDGTKPVRMANHDLPESREV